MSHPLPTPSHRPDSASGSAPSPDSPESPESPESPTQDRVRLPLPQVLTRLDTRVRPNLKRAVPALAIALVSFLVGANLGGVERGNDATLNTFGWSVTVPAGWVVAILVVLAIVFVVSGVAAVRYLARELSRFGEQRSGVAAASSVRLACLIVGYLLVFLGLLTVLQLDLGNLLVGGAVTGVIVGIAAQQTIGNFFAGLVLFFARPYVPGQRVKVLSGGMGGPFEGIIVASSTMYTTIETEGGVVSMPNSGLLAAAVSTVPDPLDPDLLLQPGDHDLDVEPDETTEADDAVAAVERTAGQDEVDRPPGPGR